MGFLDTYVTNSIVDQQARRLSLETIAATYPTYEMTTPQFQNPNPYVLAAEGYTRNEFVYTLIAKRAKAISEPSMHFYNVPDAKTRRQLENYPAAELIARPNPACTEVDFWLITQIFMDIAGFAAWEIEFNNGGEPIGLWPMRPDWCSFMRGPGQPIRCIRYQPYGLPFVDVPIGKIVLFQEFDPRFPLLKGLSRTAVGMRMIGVDNRATDYLAEFFAHGAVASGLLTTEQALNDATAEALKKRWMSTHGGSQNWSQIAVLGQGTKYQPTSMDFKNMAFAELDGRTEARLCGLFEMPPMLVSAKIGLAASTLANFEQARQAWYEESIQPIWRWFATRITTQLMPHYGAQPKDQAAFDTSGIKALQEERSKVWKDAMDAAKANIVTRAEAREKMGYDDIDDGKPIFIGVQVRGPESKINPMDPDGELTEELVPEEEETPPALPPGAETPALPGQPQPAGLLGAPKPNNPAAVPGDQATDDEAEDGGGGAENDEPATAAAKTLERRQYRAYVAKRRKEGKSAAGFRFAHLTYAEQKALRGELATADAAPAASTALRELATALREATAAVRATEEAG